MKAWTKHKNAKLYSYLIGEGPLAVFCEGGPGLCSYISPFDQEVSKFLKLCLYHSRGVGRSTDSSPYDMKTLISDLDAIRETHSIDRWIVFGHSFGADVALAYALEYSNRVSALIYISGVGINPAWHDAYRKNRKERLGRHFPEYQRLKSETIQAKGSFLEETREALRQMVLPTDFADPLYARKLPLLAYPINYKVNACAGLDWKEIIQSPLFHEQLKTCTVPVLFIHGDKDPREAKFARELSERLPAATFALLKDCGHFPWLEAKEEFYSLLRSYLAGLGDVLE